MVKLTRKFQDRYASIAPDGFFEALEQGLPKSIRVNTLKTTSSEFTSRARSHDWELTALPWYTDGFVIDREDRSQPLGHSLEHFAGHFYVQEASSMVPPLVLDPKPGERVLDMAAAPGSKTTQMAALMRNQGLLVANDSSAVRLKALSSNVERIGLLNVVVTQLSGPRLGRLLPGYFDKVLLDAPCTAEGTIAKNPELLGRWSENSIKKLSTLQLKLLLGAYYALRPGGTLVYSTCTFAPEENEGVVHEFLSLHPEAVVADFELPGLPLDDGVAEWRGVTFDPQVARTKRVWPGNLAMEGFFIAHIKKPSDVESSGEYRAYANRRYQATEETPSSWLEERFGLPPGWDDGYAWQRKDEEAWLMTPEAASFKELPAIRRGMRAARTVTEGYKPTTQFLQLFGNDMAKHIVQTDKVATKAYLQGQDLPVQQARGYVVLDHDGIVYACGLSLGDRIKNQLPVSRRIQPR